MTSVEHITVNTGHVRQSPRFEVPDLVIDVIRAALAEGANLWAGWRVRIIPPPDGGHVFDLLHVDRWIVRCWLCEDPAASEAIWESARESVLAGSFLLSGFPIPPVSTPWLAAALTVESALVGMRTPHVLLECGDAERCVAWAMLK